jgi:hypothetical protein
MPVPAPPARPGAPKEGGQPRAPAWGRSSGPSGGAGPRTRGTELNRQAQLGPDRRLPAGRRNRCWGVEPQGRRVVAYGSLGDISLTRAIRCVQTAAHAIETRTDLG